MKHAHLAFFPNMLTFPPKLNFQQKCIRWCIWRTPSSPQEPFYRKGLEQTPRRTQALSFSDAKNEQIKLLNGNAASPEAVNKFVHAWGKWLQWISVTASESIHVNPTGPRCMRQNVVTLISLRDSRRGTSRYGYTHTRIPSSRAESIFCLRDYFL